MYDIFPGIGYKLVPILSRVIRHINKRKPVLTTWGRIARRMLTGDIDVDSRIVVNGLVFKDGFKFAAVICTEQNIIQKVNRLLKTDIEPLIDAEMVFDPRVIEARTSSAFGAIYGNSSNNKFAAFMRHANFSSKIKNLYFCGGSVHPGPSIPLCLLSAKITTGMIK